MHFLNRQQKAIADESKNVLLRLMFKHEVLQEEIAFCCGVAPSTIFRWSNLEDDIFPSIFLIASCSRSDNPKLMKLAEDYLDWLEQLAGRQAVPIGMKTDGSLTDEFQDAAITEGAFAIALRDGNLENAEKVARTFMEISTRMQAEIKQKREELRKKAQ